MPHTWQRVAIVGVGLIGGSIGIDLLRRGLAKSVVGIGRNKASLADALKAHAVTDTTLDLEQGVAEADLIVVCTPVGQIAADVRRAATACRPGTIITDAGSTKAAIVAELDGQLAGDVAFVGSHPLAGSEKRGPTAATADLFVDRTVVVTPSERSRSADVSRVTGFWKSLGARVVTIAADEHDRIVAATSHLPHIAASALAASLVEGDLPLVARGWLDATRLAAGDPGLWRQILLANRDHLLDALRRYDESLGRLRAALEHADGDAIERFLADAKQTRDRFET
ncbi:MAG TPA: prephenate dehydrogenase/arogenate dehydrogenase family protein [Pirellulales bacterium]|nr:prephenate dehydrogenase/arogenate dehydrogenase family protein [Pirellulales bacterium]